MTTDKTAAGLASEATLDRREFVARLIELVPDALIVTGLGSSTYDAFAAGDRPQNFYLWGAMGGALSIGLGLAIAQPDKAVVVITGDGEQLMGIGSLATAGVHKVPNLSVVVLDNRHFGETGMQASHSGLGVDLTAVAKACGIAQSEQIERIDALGALADRIRARQATTFAQVFVKSDSLPRALPPRDGVYVKNRFREHLGLAPM